FRSFLQNCWTTVVALKALGAPCDKFLEERAHASRRPATRAAARRAGCSDGDAEDRQGGGEGSRQQGEAAEQAGARPSARNCARQPVADGRRAWYKSGVCRRERGKPWNPRSSWLLCSGVVLRRPGAGRRPKSGRGVERGQPCPDFALRSRTHGRRD